MSFLKNIDTKIKIISSIFAILSVMGGALFFMEDRWNQKMSVTAAKDEVEKKVESVENDVVSSLKILNQKVEKTSLTSQYSTIKLLQLQNKTNLKQKPNDEDFLKMEEQLIVEEKKIVNKLANTDDSD